MLQYPDTKPLTRAGCHDMPRPCPFVACRHHLQLDIFRNETNITPARVVLHLDPDDWTETTPTCSLDLADNEEGITLDEVGQIIGVVRERARQIEVGAMAKLSRSGVILAHAKDLYLVSRSPPSPTPPATPTWERPWSLLRESSRAAAAALNALLGERKITTHRFTLQLIAAHPTVAATTAKLGLRWILSALRPTSVWWRRAAVALGISLDDLCANKEWQEHVTAEDSNQILNRPPAPPQTTPTQAPPLKRPAVRSTKAERTILAAAAQLAAANLSQILATRGLSRISAVDQIRTAYRGRFSAAAILSALRHCAAMDIPTSVWWRRIAFGLGLSMEDISTDALWLSALPTEPTPETSTEVLAPMVLDLLEKIQTQDRRLSELLAVQSILQSEIETIKKENIRLGADLQKKNNTLKQLLILATED